MTGGGKSQRRALQSRPARATYATLVVLFSLLVQLLFVPYHQASATPAGDAGRIAAELKATFGSTASLCVRSDDSGSPQAPADDCSHDCPFCRFAAEAATLVSPDAPALPVRSDHALLVLGRPAAPDGAPSAPQGPQQARAPPFAV